MKVAVIGIGGVGGYVAGMLASHMPQVTVVARGERGVSIREKGLILHSDYNGEIVAHPQVVPSVAELPEQDLIFVCVKNYSLAQVLEDLKGKVTEKTVIVPIMNGVDPGDRIREALPEVTVVDSLIYIVAFANPDYSVGQKGQFSKIVIGTEETDEKAKAAVALADQALTEGEIDHKVGEDVRREIWKKYILNCAYNVSTARYHTTIGPVRDDKHRCLDYMSLVNEAAAVGKAQGVKLQQGDIDFVIWRFYRDHAYEAGSSLQRDVCAGKTQTELETFSGYIVKTGEKLGVPTPVSKEYYEALKAEGFC